MRFALVLFALMVAACVTAQKGSNRSLFLTTRVDATVVVTKSRTGADMVQVTVLDPAYPQSLLRKQIARLGTELKCDPRGVDVGYFRAVESDPSSLMLRATFAVDGVIDRANGALRLRALARAFALAEPPNAVNALMIEFKRETPTPNTLRSCAPPEPGCAGAIVEGRAEGADVGIEYRLKYLTHDPDAIDLPDTPREVPVRKLPAKAKTSVDWTIVVLVIVGAAAAGALVYSLLLGSRRPRNPPAGGLSTRSVDPRSGTQRNNSGRASGGRRLKFDLTSV